jgi:uncharacterized membrane protein YedE/YeeE
MGAVGAAFAIGIAFGACLERAGLGSARKLMGQFDLTDLAVFKVMFSAIVTAMLGLFWLSRLGVLDMQKLYLPDTFLLPQLIGGALFGVGFAVAGLCPGTSCVAAATGRLDGVGVMLGMFAGVLGTGAALPSLQRFYLATARGGLTLPRLLGIPEGVVILVIVGVALVAFGFTARVEQRALSLSSRTSAMSSRASEAASLSSRASEAAPLSSRASEASVGINFPGAGAGHPHGIVDPDTRSLRSLLRDDTRGGRLRSLLRDDNA